MVLWRLLDFETGIVGVVDVVALPDGGVAVAWTDYSGSPPAGRLVIVNAQGRRISVEELPQTHQVAGMVPSAAGTLAVAQQENLTSGSITLVGTGKPDRRDLVRPAAVGSHTEMLVLGEELLWTSSSGGGFVATDLATGKTRRLVATGNSTFNLTTMPDRRTVGFIDDGRLVLVDVTSGETTGPTTNGEVVAAAATERGLAFITKEGETKVLRQCPGDSGPGTDGALRVGRLSLWQAGRATELEVDLGNQEATSVVPVGRSDQVLVSAVGADDKGCPDDASLYRVNVATGQLVQVVAELDGAVRATPGGQVAYLNNGSLFVRSLSGDNPVEILNPAETDAMNSFAWTEDESLWFVSDMDVDRKGRGEPRLWVRRPGGALEAKDVL